MRSTPFRRTPVSLETSHRVIILCRVRITSGVVSTSVAHFQFLISARVCLQHLRLAGTNSSSLPRMKEFKPEVRRVPEVLSLRLRQASTSSTPLLVYRLQTEPFLISSCRSRQLQMFNKQIA